MKQNPLNFHKWFRSGLSIVLSLTIISSLWLFISSVRWDRGIPLKNLNYHSLVLALFALLATWLIEACRIGLIAAGLGENISLKQVLNINLASGFMGNITPFSSGGVPTQIYLLCQAGIKPGKSSAIVTIRVILSTLLFTMVAPILLFFYHTNFSAGFLHKVTTIAIPVSALISITLIGFIIQPKLAKYLIAFPLKLIKSPALLKKIEPHLQNFLEEVEIFHKSIREFRKGYHFILVVLATMGYWFCFFTIAPLLINAFGLSGSEVFLKSILIQFILIFIIAYLPIPGGSGVMEVSFFSTFVFIPTQIRAIIILLWRFLSYHLGTFVGGIILLRLINRPSSETSEGVQG